MILRKSDENQIFGMVAMQDTAGHCFNLLLKSLNMKPKIGTSGKNLDYRLE